MDRAGVLACGSDDAIVLIPNGHLHGHFRLHRRAVIGEVDVEERGVRQTPARVGIGAVALPLHALVQLFDGLVPKIPVFIRVEPDLAHGHARTDREIGFLGVGDGDDVLVILEGEGTALGLDGHDAIDREGSRRKRNGSLAVHSGIQQVRVLPGDMHGLHVRRIFRSFQRLVQLDLHLDRRLGLDLIHAGFVHDGDVEESRLLDAFHSVRQNTLGSCRGLLFLVCFCVHRFSGLLTICLILFGALDDLPNDQLSVVRDLCLRSVGNGDQERLSIMGEDGGLQPRANDHVCGKGVGIEDDLVLSGLHALGLVHHIGSTLVIHVDDQRILRLRNGRADQRHADGKGRLDLLPDTFLVYNIEGDVHGGDTGDFLVLLHRLGQGVHELLFHRDGRHAHKGPLGEGAHGGDHVHGETVHLVGEGRLRMGVLQGVDIAIGKDEAFLRVAGQGQSIALHFLRGHRDLADRQAGPGIGPLVLGAQCHGLIEVGGNGRLLDFLDLLDRDLHHARVRVDFLNGGFLGLQLLFRFDGYVQLHLHRLGAELGRVVLVLEDGGHGNVDGLGLFGLFRLFGFGNGLFVLGVYIQIPAHHSFTIHRGMGLLLLAVLVEFDAYGIPALELIPFPGRRCGKLLPDDGILLHRDLRAPVVFAVERDGVGHRFPFVLLLSLVGGVRIGFGAFAGLFDVTGIITGHVGAVTLGSHILRILGHLAVAQDRTIAQAIGEGLHLVGTVALDGGDPAAGRADHDAHVVGSAAVRREEDHVARLGLILAGGMVQALARQRILEVLAARGPGHAHLRELDTEGHEGSAPVAVGVAGPGAVPGVELPVTVLGDDIVSIAGRIAQLGPGYSHQVLRPIAGKLRFGHTVGPGFLRLTVGRQVRLVFIRLLLLLGIAGAFARLLGFAGAFAGLLAFASAFTGLLAFAGALARLLGFAGALARLLAFAGALAGLLAFAGALAGLLGFAGALAGLLAFARALAGLLGFARAFAGLLGFARAFAGLLGFARAFARLLGFAGAFAGLLLLRLRIGRRGRVGLGLALIGHLGRIVFQFIRQGRRGQQRNDHHQAQHQADQSFFHGFFPFAYYQLSVLSFLNIVQRF